MLPRVVEDEERGLRKKLLQFSLRFLTSLVSPVSKVYKSSIPHMSFHVCLSITLFLVFICSFGLSLIYRIFPVFFLSAVSLEITCKITGLFSLVVKILWQMLCLFLFWKALDRAPTEDLLRPNQS
jgi:hypothetical protein